MSEPIQVTPQHFVWRPRFNDDGRRSRFHVEMVARNWIKRLAKRSRWLMPYPAKVEFDRDPSMRRTDVFVHFEFVSRAQLTMAHVNSRRKSLEGEE